MIIWSWMLQPTATTPARSSNCGPDRSPGPSTNSKDFAGANEYAWWRVVSEFRNTTESPGWNTSTYGMKVSSRWSITRVTGAGREGVACVPATTAVTTASGAGRPWASATSTRSSAPATQAGSSRHTQHADRRKEPMGHPARARPS